MAHNQHITTCIVEDETSLRNSLKELINTSAEIRCVADFPNAEECLAFLRDEDVDVVLLDIGLPGISGLDAIPKIRELAPDAKILILTMLDDDDSVFKAFTWGASGFILKSSGRETLLTDISRVHNGALIYSINIARKVLKLNSYNKDFDLLTTREEEILRLVIKGYTKPKMADTLFISIHTVDSHLRNIYSKIQVNSKYEAIAKALRQGWGGEK